MLTEGRHAFVGSGGNGQTMIDRNRYIDKYIDR
jgi:hypothetical protein